MADINWGLLQTNPTGDVHFMNAPAQQVQSSSGGGGGMDPLAQQKLQLEKNQDARAAALQPGLLQQQSLSNQQTQQAMQQASLMNPLDIKSKQLSNTNSGLMNQEEQTKLQSAQIQMQRTQAISKAYQEGSNKGGPDGGISAAIDMAAKTGDLQGALTASSAFETMKGLRRDNNVKGVLDVANAMQDIKKAVIPPTPAQPAMQDPKTGQMIPAKPATEGKSSLDIYAERYPMLKATGIIPEGIAAPNEIKNASDFENHVMLPVMGIANPIAKQVSAQNDFIGKQKLAAANQVVGDAYQKFTSAMAQYGAKDPRTLDAATNYSLAQRQASQTAAGGGFVSEAIESVRRALPNMLGGEASPQQLIRQEQKAQMTKQPSSPGASGTVTNPTGASQAPQTQVLDGKTYVNVPGSGWHVQGQ